MKGFSQCSFLAHFFFPLFVVLGIDPKDSIMLEALTSLAVYIFLWRYSLANCLPRLAFNS
jgi:hypothetical protein